MRKIILLFSISFLLSCDENDNKNIDIDLFGNLETYFYNQTRCSDPWDAGSSDSQDFVEAKLRGLLDDKGVNVEKVHFDGNTDINTCFACHCISGV